MLEKYLGAFVEEVSMTPNVQSSAACAKGALFANAKSVSFVEVRCSVLLGAHPAARLVLDGEAIS